MSEEPRLTPTQDLLLEVLAARYRQGEHIWTFAIKFLVPLRKLADLGLVEVVHGVVPDTIRAKLSPAGLALMLDPDFTVKAPGLPLEWAVELCTRTFSVWDTRLDHWSLGAASAGRMTQDQLKLTDRADATAYATWLAQRFGARQVRVVSRTVGPWEPEN